MPPLCGTRKMGISAGFCCSSLKNKGQNSVLLYGCLSACMFTMCMIGTWQRSEEVADSLELVMNHHVGARNGTCVL